MNSQEIVFVFENKENEVLQKMENYAPLLRIKDNGTEFAVFLHPILGHLFVEKNDELILTKTFFPKPTTQDYYELGKLAKQFSNIGAQYKIFLSNDKKQRLIFEHKLQEQFYSE